MAFKLLSTPQRGHLIARRRNSASASFLLHLQHLISFTGLPIACRLWHTVCTVRCLGRTQARTAEGGR